MVQKLSRILRRILITVFVLLGIVFAAILLIQASLSGFLSNYVHSELGWSLKIGAAHIQFHPLSIHLEKIELSAPEQKPFLQADSASVDLPYSFFWGKEFQLNHLIVDSPRIDLELLPSRSESKKEISTKTKSFRIESALIRRGEVRYKEYQFKEIDLESQIASGNIHIQKLKSKFHDVTLEAAGSLKNAKADLSYEVRGNAQQMSFLLPTEQKLKGDFVAKGFVKGEMPNPIITGSVESHNLIFRESAPFSISGRYQYDFHNRSQPATIQLDFNSLALDVVRNYWNEMPPFSSVAHGTLQYSGGTDVKNGNGNFAIQLEAATLSDSEAGLSHSTPEKPRPLPLSGKIDGHFQNGMMQIDRSTLLLRNSRLDADGTFSHDSLFVKADFQTSNLRDISFLYSKFPSARGNYHVQAQLTGFYEDINVAGELTGQSGDSLIRVKGTTRLGSKMISLQFQGNADAATLQNLLPDLHKGQIQFEGVVDGTWKQPKVNGSWNATNVQIQSVELQQFSGDVETVGNNLKLQAVIPELQLQLDGTYRIDNGAYQMRGVVDGAQVKTVVALINKEEFPISGKVSGNFEASGNTHRWRESIAAMQMHATEIQWKGVAVNIPNAEIQLEKRVMHLKTRAESGNIQLEMSGTALLEPGIPLDLQVNGRIAGEVLEKISSDWKANGELNLDATIKGKSSNPKLEGELNAENFTMKNASRNWNVVLNHAQVSLSEQKLKLQGEGKFNNSVFLCNGNLPLENLEGNLHFEISDLPVSTFTDAQNVSGSFDVAGDLQGKGFPLREWQASKSVGMPFREWSGNISVSPYNLKLGEQVLSVDEPVHLEIQNHELHLAPTRIYSGDLLDFRSSGSLNLNTGELKSSAHLEARIDLLSSLKADIQSSGPLKADLQLSGTLEKPQYQGTIELSNASLRIPESPLALESLELHASMDNKRLIVDKLQARSGGGVIDGGGNLIFGAKGNQVWLQGKNVAANYPEGLRSQIDFDLKLSSLESAVLLSGDIKVLRSFYEQQFNLRNPIIRRLLASTTELTSEKQLKNKVKLAINIQTVDDLRLKNNLANLMVGGGLKIEGSLYKPRLTGLLNIRPGSRMYLAGNQYDVEKASVEFFGSEFIEPNLDITLYSMQRDFQTDTYYEVFLPFGGPLSDIEFKTVRSIPSLSQEQIFSLITQGTVESEHIGSSRAIFQRQILSTVAGQVLGAPGTAFAKTIGLSRIQVQQEGLSSVNDPKTRLMVGKDIGSGFSLIYSFVLNDPQDQTWIASYRYGRNIIGRFIDQDDGTYTVSASHRIPFGKGAKPISAHLDSMKKHRNPRITSVELKNNSPLTEKQIQDILKVEAGDVYDYWDLQDRIDELKKELQKMDYLYSVIDIREKQDQKNVVSLQIEVAAFERAQMVFRGYEIGDKLLDSFMRKWRSGISPIVVQQMIQEDLLRQIQLTGCYKASVISRTEKTNERTIYFFDVDSGQKFTSVELQFKGTEHYDPQILEKDLNQLYPSTAVLFREAIHKFSDFSEKIRMLYLQKGYLRTVIEPGPVQYSTSTGKIVRSIEIKEGPPSYIAAVSIAERESIPDQLQPQMQLLAGKTFHPEALLDDESKIHDFYESQGYQNISVRYNLEFSKGSSDVLLRWNVDSGPVARIASIRIEGNQSTRTDLIMKQIGLKQGDLLTQQNQSLARKRLSDLGVFQQIGIEREETDQPGLYDVVIRVVENKKYEFQYGGRYNTDDNFGAEIRLTDFNFLGRAQSLSLYLRSTLDLPLFRVDYMMPVIGNFWDRTRFSIFRDETDEDVRATISGDLVKIPFTKKQLTFQFQQDHRLWSFFRLFWGFQFGSLTADFEDLNSRPLEFQGTEALFHMAFLTDRRDDPLNATRGYFYSLDGEYAPKIFGTDISYVKNFSQFFYYKKIGKIVSASGIRVGFLAIRSNVLTFGEKFRTGGSTTMRGFEYNTVVPGDDPISIFFGGDSVLILNEEIRFPIHKWLSGATFLDIGNVYLHASDFDPTNLRYSSGLGLRVGSGAFLLRFDFGFNLDPDEDESRMVFHFGIGQAF